MIYLIKYAIKLIKKIKLIIKYYKSKIRIKYNNINIF